jgi:hypothetical protein
MTKIIYPLHVEDVPLFAKIQDAMKTVASNYRLRLTSIEPMTMPATGMADRLGECSHDGRIRLVLRCTVNGEWCDAPMSPDEVWDTAAHELAHLRFFDHSTDHAEFTLELLAALRNSQKSEDHRDKIIGKLIKMQAQRDSEAKIGNEAAAEAFASAINRMLLEHELNPSDLDYARAKDDDPIIEMKANLSKFDVDALKVRVAWQESLAAVVARANLCKFLIRAKSNEIWFVGTRSHAMVAEYTYGILVAAAETMSVEARNAWRNQLRRELGTSSDRELREKSEGRSIGFREAWLEAFVGRIRERFEEARRAMVAAAPAPVAGGTSTALIRLDGAMTRVQNYIDDKFSHRRGSKTLSSLHSRARNNDAGRERGRAAADAMAIGRRGMTNGNGSSRKLLS